MREKYMGQTGRVIVNGDKVEMTFYSYDEPLSSVVGVVQGGYKFAVKNPQACLWDENRFSLT